MVLCNRRCRRHHARIPSPPIPSSLSQTNIYLPNNNSPTVDSVSVSSSTNDRNNDGGDFIVDDDNAEESNRDHEISVELPSITSIKIPKKILPDKSLLSKKKKKDSTSNSRGDKLVKVDKSKEKSKSSGGHRPDASCKMQHENKTSR